MYGWITGEVRGRMGGVIRPGCDGPGHTRHRQSGAPAYGSDAVIGGERAFVVLGGGDRSGGVQMDKTPLPAETTASPPAQAPRGAGGPCGPWAPVAGRDGRGGRGPCR